LSSNYKDAITKFIAKCGGESNNQYWILRRRNLLVKFHFVSSRLLYWLYDLLGEYISCETGQIPAYMPFQEELCFSSISGHGCKKLVQQC